MAMKDLKPDKPNFARAGKIRLGIKVKNKAGIEYPKEVEYFVLKDVPELAEHFQQTIGTDRPTELPIFFPFDDIDSCLDGWHKLHMASSLWCKGDGETINYAIDTGTGKRVVNNGVVIRDFEIDETKFLPGDTVRCPGHNKVEAWGRCQFCSPHTTLSFMIRGLPVDKLEMAMYHIETPSANNYPRLYEQLLGIKRLAKMLKGREYLAGIPIVLKRVQAEIGAPNLDKNGNRKIDKDGKKLPARMRTKHYLLELSVERDWVQQAVEGQMRLMSPEKTANKMITEAIEQDGTEDAVRIIDGELVNDDYNAFQTTIIERIPFYQNGEQIDAALVELELVYDPENEDMLRDELAKYADRQADTAAAGEEQKQEALL